MMKDIYKYEDQLISEGYNFIAGTDEAGRGPMAGPLVAASVVLPKHYRLDNLNDSKKLSPKMRDKLYDIIIKDALDYQITVISCEDVDLLNVYKASKVAMEQCIKNSKVAIDYVLTDCMKLDISIPYLDLVKGDSKSASIAAASVLAKVTRDRIMEEADVLYPEYGFKKHKGYVTKYHLQQLHQYGVCPIHRRTFAPVAEQLNREKQ